MSQPAGGDEDAHLLDAPAPRSAAAPPGGLGRPADLPAARSARAEDALLQAEEGVAIAPAAAGTGLGACETCRCGGRCREPHGIDRPELIARALSPVGLGPPPTLGARRRAVLIGCTVVVVVVVIVFSGLFLAGYFKPLKSISRTPLILVSLDGFRWDYLEKYHEESSNLRSIARRGFRASKFVPVFPSKTFPNHYTIVTGLYPENHGIVSNNMYDPVLGHFTLSDRNATDDGRWWGGTPLWVSAETQGVRSGTVFWPGSSAAIRGVRPSLWLPYDGAMSMEKRVQQVLAWLDLPAATRPSFLTLYMEPVDSMGHEFGPNSEEVRRAVRQVDDAIGLLLVGLRIRGLADKVNILVVSDHGMTALSPERVVTLDSYLDLGPSSGLFVVDWSPVLAIKPNGTAAEDRAYAALKAAHPRLVVYEKQMIPERLHYQKNPRIQSFIGIADVGWSLTDSKTAAAHPEYFRGGQHGYDPHVGSDMHGIFLGQGPDLRAGGADAGEVRNLDVYGLACALLRVDASPNDGALERVRHVLAAA